MRIAIVVCFVFSVFSLSAQILPSHYDTLFHGKELILDGNLDFSSSSVLKETSSVFYRGGTIDSDMIQRSLDRHKAVNRIGFDASSELTFRSFKPIINKFNLGYQIVAGTYYFGGARYSKDLFDFVFNGNSSFDNDTIDFSGTDINYTAFQKIGFGLISNKSRSFLNFNVYNIQDRIDLNVRTGEVQQSTNIDTINVVSDFTLSTKSNLAFNQGIGFGVDFTYYMPIQWKEERSAIVEFQVKNLGYAYMYQDQEYYQADTNFTYSGFRFDQLIGESAINFDSLNVLDTLGITSINRKYGFLLPGFIQVAKIVDDYSDVKWQPFFGLRIYPTLNYNPYAFGGIDFKPTDNIHIGASASYGGFAKFKGGIYFSAYLKSIRVALGTENIFGAVSGKGNGISANLRLSCVF